MRSLPRALLVSHCCDGNTAAFSSILVRSLASALTAFPVPVWSEGQARSCGGLHRERLGFSAAKGKNPFNSALPTNRVLFEIN